MKWNKISLIKIYDENISNMWVNKDTDRKESFKPDIKEPYQDCMKKSLFS